MQSIFTHVVYVILAQTLCDVQSTKCQSHFAGKRTKTQELKPLPRFTGPHLELRSSGSLASFCCARLEWTERERESCPTFLGESCSAPLLLHACQCPRNFLQPSSACLPRAQEYGSPHQENYSSSFSSSLPVQSSHSPFQRVLCNKAFESFY